MDRTLLKVSGIIAIILGVIYCITIIGLIVGIPLIIGGNKFVGYSGLSDDDLKNQKDSILCWSIFFLFFTVIGGVLGLIYYFQLSGAIDSIENIIPKQSKKEDYINEIERLKKLYDDGIITKKEYEDKKKKLLDI